VSLSYRANETERVARPLLRERFVVVLSAKLWALAFFLVTSVLSKGKLVSTYSVHEELRSDYPCDSCYWFVAESGEYHIVVLHSSIMHMILVYDTTFITHCIINWYSLRLEITVGDIIQTLY
jgi:hypothetical protein